MHMLYGTKLQLFDQTSKIAVKQKILHDILGRQVIALDLNQTFKVHVKAQKCSMLETSVI